MVNKKEVIKLSLEVLSLLIVVLSMGWLTRVIIGPQFFLEDSANFGWVLGVIGTVYTLVAAFVIFGVWSQFNELASLITKESRLLVALWDVIDYFNDRELDKRIKTALISYIDETVNRELAKMAKGERINTYSKEFIGIREAIDKIRFDDARDNTIFPVVVELYRDLLDVRDQRTEAGITRLPTSLKLLFLILSSFLIASFIILGFAHLELYLFSLAFGGLIVIFMYEVIKDLDNPFGGVFQLEYEPLKDAKNYIERSEHG